MKKIVCLLMISTMLFVFCIMSASALDSKVTFGEITCCDNAENPLNDDVMVQIISAPADNSIILFAAYVDKTTGKILSCGTVTYQTSGSSETATITLTDKSVAGAELKCYFWDSMNNCIPLKNTPPTAPADLKAPMENVKSNEVTLNWENAFDDYDEINTYDIYDEGMLVAENVSGNEALVTNLDWGKEYTFDVIAKDSDGEYSKTAATVNVRTDDILTAVTAGDNIENPHEGKFKFELIEADYYDYTQASEAGGLPCRVTGPKEGSSKANTFLAYRFTENYLEEISDERRFVIELTYYDEGTDKITITTHHQKAGTDGTSKSTKVEIMKTGTNTWKTVRRTLVIEDKFLYNPDPKNANNNFRINTPTPGFKVYRFSVMPENEYNPNNAYFNTDDANITLGMDALTAQRATRYTEIDGAESKPYVKLSDIDNSFDFTVTDTGVKNGTDAYMEINFYAPEENTEIFVDGIKVQTEVASGKWQKVRFSSSDIGSHTITTGNNEELYIHSVNVVSTK